MFSAPDRRSATDAVSSEQSYCSRVRASSIQVFDFITLLPVRVVVCDGSKRGREREAERGRERGQEER